MADAADKTDQRPKGNGPIKTLFIVVGVAVATSVVTVWLTTAYLFPGAFEPVKLSHEEQVVLDSKLKTLNVELRANPAPGNEPSGVLEPRRYSEEGASREVVFSQREVNALIAANTDLASKVAIDFSPDLVSARILVPLDPDMPIFGGKTLKIAAGLELRYRSGRPVVVLKGVSLWGVPVPNAWLGNLKNVDLVQEYGDEGFWKAFAAGVDNIAVGDGRVTIKLKG